MAGYKHFLVRNEDGVTIVRLLDITLLRQQVLDALREELLSYVDFARPDKLLISFPEVEYCTSSAISGLLSVKRRLSAHGGEVKLCEPTDAVAESFKRLGLTDKVFPVYDSVEDGVKSFAGQLP